jgi:hypothetical protein
MPDDLVEQIDEEAERTGLSCPGVARGIAGVL